MYRFRSLVVSLCFSVFCFALQSAAQQTCTIPPTLPEPKVPGVDWKNTTARTDYYALALSWSPEHCHSAREGAGKQFQCTLNHFEFVVHGLWPQAARARDKFGHPRHCKPSSPLSAVLVQQHLCTVPGVELMQGEWSKHGVCAFPTPVAYFDKIDEVWQGLKKPDMKVLAAQKRHNLTAHDVVQAFVDVNKSSRLQADNVIVQVGSGNFLREVLVCYDLQYAYQKCKIQGTPATQKIKVRF